MEAVADGEVALWVSAMALVTATTAAVETRVAAEEVTVGGPATVTAQVTPGADIVYLLCLKNRKFKRS
jgi:hypothetical protein